MTFSHHLEQLPEKLEQAELIARGYRWGRKDGVAHLARQIHAAINAHGNFITAIAEAIAPYLNNINTGSQK